MEKNPVGLKRAIAIAGGQRPLARLINVGQSEIYRWLKITKEVPAHRVRPICEALDWKLSRHDLRPDLYKKGE
jgi:DNA-binding transcriptional regulator YdaS (Cro superfamily)